MGALKKFDKLFLVLGVMAVVLLTPEIALAKGAGEGIANMLWKTIRAVVSGYLFPDDKNPYIGAACVALGMVALLWNESARKFVGRASGIPLVFLALRLAWPIASTVVGILWGMIPFGTVGKIIAAVIIFFSITAIISMAVGIAKGFISGLWAFLKARLMDPNPSILYSVVGALFISGFINSSKMSNEANHYAGSWVCVIAGAFFLAHGAYKRWGKAPMKRRKHIKNTGYTPEGEPVCNNISLKTGKECGKVNTQGTLYCEYCKALIPHAKWNCHGQHQDGTPCHRKDISGKVGHCPECGTERPAPKDLKGRMSIPTPSDKKGKKAIQKAIQKGKAICPHCGQENRAEDKFCRHCKKKMEGGGDPKTPADKKPKPDDKGGKKTTKDSGDKTPSAKTDPGKSEFEELNRFDEDELLKFITGEE